jgi:hypothetical protein
MEPSLIGGLYALLPGRVNGEQSKLNPGCARRRLARFFASQAPVSSVAVATGIGGLPHRPDLRLSRIRLRRKIGLPAAAARRDRAAAERGGGGTQCLRNGRQSDWYRFRGPKLTHSCYSVDINPFSFSSCLQVENSCENRFLIPHESNK